MADENTSNEPMTNFRELLNTLVASQVQLREDFNTLCQKLQGKDANTSSPQTNESEAQNPSLTVGEKKMMERIDQMEQLIKKSRREDAMDLHSLSLFPNARVPPKFKMPTLDKFDGTGCPKAHLKMYTRALQPLGATEELLAQMFQNTLTGAALRWFLSLEDSKTRTWEDIGNEFYRQYKYNTEVDITRRDLETTKQEPKESFSSFITRWRAKAAQMTNRPNEEEQLGMVVKNLLPTYHKYLFAQYFPSFKALVAAGIQIEDAMNNGTIKGEEIMRPKKTFGPSSSKIPEVSTINQPAPYQLIAPTPVPKAQPQRQFHELHMPLSKVFEKLQARGLLRPLDPKPMPNPLPRGFDVNKRCSYHQTPGHHTDDCFSLRHAIQNLIDQKIIAPPPRPNVISNPLPNHALNHGPRINCLFEEGLKEDPSILISDIPICAMLTWEEVMETELPPAKPKLDIWEEEPTNEPTKEPTPTPLSLDHQNEITHITRGGKHFKPSYLEADNPLEALNQQLKNTQLQPEDDIVLKQLQKTQANISLWGLLVASYHHRQTLINLLNQIQVPTNLTPQALNTMIGAIKKEPSISYSDKDLSSKGRDHNDPLHITVDTNGKRVPMVLIDDGSALNMCPLRTASCLGLSIEDFAPSCQYVRAYDNTRREVLGNVTLDLKTGPTIQKVEFQVMDISTCFNLLLGRPWIHSTGAVPSSLYQKVRFPYKDSIITIFGDSQDNIGPIHGIQEEKSELFLSGFELEEVPAISWIKEETRECFPMDFDPYSNVQVIAMMKKMKYFPGMGLGRRNKGVHAFPHFSTSIPPFGLGYKPTNDELLENDSNKIARAKAKAQGLSFEPISMKPYTPTLNGKFVKEGCTHLYYGFPEPWYDFKTMKKMPGFEIFADCKIDDGEEVNALQDKREDWVCHMDPQAMKTLLGEHVLNMKKDEGDELPSIFPITSNMENWTIEEPLDELSEGYASDESWGVVMEEDVKSLEDQEEEEPVFQLPPPLARNNFDLWDDWGASFTDPNEMPRGLLENLRTYVESLPREVGNMGEQVDDHNYIDISSDDSKSNMSIIEVSSEDSEVDEGIYMLQKEKTNKEVPPITEATSVLKNWSWEECYPSEGHQVTTKSSVSVEKTMSVPIESVIAPTESVSISDKLAKSVTTFFNSNKMISDFAYLLALNVFIAEIDNGMVDKSNELKEEIQLVNLGSDDEPKAVQIGNTLTSKEKDELISLLKEFLEVFAWSYKDMPGIDMDIVQHHIPTDSTMKPVKQKLRRMKPEWTLKIKEEVEKQYNAGFLKVVNYPEWLANVVPVPKKDGKVRMCVDFRDLNKASPKDDFPLPHIDVLVDNTADHARLSFMDGFSGYNQIKMAPEDMEKTSFITPWGTYCYKVMLLVLRMRVPPINVPPQLCCMT